MHRSHEYLGKIAIETLDGVMIHSLLGKLKPGDMPAEVRSCAIGKPSPTSFQFFFLACYDIERFEEFLQSQNFRNVCALDDAEHQDQWRHRAL